MRSLMNFYLIKSQQNVYADFFVQVTKEILYSLMPIYPLNLPIYSRIATINSSSTFGKNCLTTKSAELSIRWELK